MVYSSICGVSLVLHVLHFDTYLRPILGNVLALAGSYIFVLFGHCPVHACARVFVSCLSLRSFGCYVWFRFVVLRFYYFACCALVLVVLAFCPVLFHVACPVLLLMPVRPRRVALRFRTFECTAAH